MALLAKLSSVLIQLATEIARRAQSRAKLIAGQKATWNLEVVP